jgi:hypothetical protein
LHIAAFGDIPREGIAVPHDTQQITQLTKEQ